jgi:2-hydroxy-6-oxo-6-(2'-carboxyphenyl)-hexa-2,4-dienoate hydrolase
MRGAFGVKVLVFAGAMGVAHAEPAARCTPERIELDRGETRRVLLCGDGMPANATLTATAGLTIRYQQALRHCDVGDQRPGVLLVVETDDRATAGSLTVADPRTNQPACPPLAVDVPDRLRLPDARLTRTKGNDLKLEVHAPASGDLDTACARGVEFPDGDGLSLVEATPPAYRCRGSRLTMAVRARDARQMPAKIVVPLAGGKQAVTYAAPPSPRYADAMRESDAKYVDVNGIRTRYFEKGSGEPLVLVHGGQPTSADGTAWDWQRNFDGLAERFHVYALDRVGQGYTGNPHAEDGYRNYYPLVVEHVWGFIQALGLKRAHLAGHSQGSWPVTRIALDHPEQVASLILVDGTMVSPPKDAGQAMRFYLYLSTDLHPLEGDTAESVRRGLEMFSFTKNHITDQHVERVLTMSRLPKYAEARRWFAETQMSPAHPAFRALKQQILGELEAGKLRVPVLVVWGRNDPEGSLESGLELFRTVSHSSPRSRLHVFGRCGHLPFVEYPEEFNRLVIDFVAR